MNTNTVDELKAIMNDEYLGDGVYVSHDGYHIWLAVNHHENKVVAIEASVMRALIVYAQKFETHKKNLNPEQKIK